MEQKFSSLEVMEAANHSENSAMEAENHVKHGASSKSQTSRINFLRKTCFITILFAAIFASCGKDGKDGEDGRDGTDGKDGADSKIPVTLVTNAATGITSTTARLGGIITYAGMPEYTERGVCYAATVNPTVSDNKKVIEGTGTGNFSIEISDLAIETTYYARAYAISALGTFYGEQIDFITSLHPGEPELIFVQGGTFTMGSPVGTPNSNDTERPARQVTLSSYSIGKYPVTQGQWIAVMGSNPSHFKKGNNYPVETVSWNDVQVFIAALNTETGKNYRLATEAEWEYAARGGNKSQGYIFSGSNTVNDVSWNVTNSNNSTQPVGTKYPNELGIYDMSGNVWEWCSDWWGTYPSDAETNPTGPSTGPGRVIRGGPYNLGGSISGDISVRHRSYTMDHSGQENVGFRLVLP